MKKNNALLLTLLIAISLPALSWAQQDNDTTESTTIDSDTLSLKVKERIALLSGNVKVKDKSFEMKANELEIHFSKENKIEKLVAKGSVKIQQGNKQSESLLAEYFVNDKKIILTGNPVVMEKDNRVTGKTITIFPEEDRMEVAGGSRIQLFIEP